MKKLLLTIISSLALGGMATAQQTDAAVAAADTQPRKIISQQPDGELKEYYRTSTGYYNNFGTLTHVDVDGYVGKVVFDDRKRVYFYNIFSKVYNYAWLRGNIDGNIIRIDMPQAAYETLNLDENDRYYYTVYYANKVKVNDDGFELDSEKNYIELEVMEDGSIVQRGDDMIALCDENGDWLWYGDTHLNYQVFDSTIPTAPKTAVTEEWKLFSGNMAETVNVSIEGDRMYVDHINPEMPEAVAMGVIEGDKVRFATDQYLGQNGAYYSFFKSAAWGEIYDDRYDTYYEDYKATDEIVFDYDTARKRLKSSEAFLLNYGKSDVFYKIDYDKPSIKFIKTPTEATKPLGAEFVSVTPYSPSKGWGEAVFNLPQEDVNGDVLSPSQLTYQLYFDGELKSFGPDQYERLVREMDTFGYNFTDDWDIFVDGSKHTFYFYDDINTIGVKVINTFGGKSVESDIVTYDLATQTGIDDVAGSSRVTGVSYTNIAGCRVGAGTKGILLKTVTYQDGSTRTVKVAR